jgi:predicted Zn-dependent protease
MLGKNRIRELTQFALAASKADQTEVVVWVEDSSLTRCANSYIHQNVAEANVDLRVRAVIGKKIGIAATNDLSKESIGHTVDHALDIARCQPDNPDFISLPGPAPIARVDGFVEHTAGFSPEERAQAISILCRKANDAGVTASGAFLTTAYEFAVANSLGVFAYHPTTLADFNTVVMSDTGSGYASFTSIDVGELDAEALADEAVSKALRSRKPIAIDAGEYEVILEEYAVSDILDFLLYLGFSALAVQEGRSFMGGKLSQKIIGENITIWDDGCSRDNLPLPFDFEGVPRQRLTLIENGIAKAVVYDSYIAGRDGHYSTGHALPAIEESEYGPLPIHLFLAPGTSTKEEMLKGIQRGLWVTRFNYTRPVHPLPVLITGMTRDGTFLIEHGEVTRPVKNLRFTQSYLEALSNVEAIGQATKLMRNILDFGANRVPALKISTFAFTGTTEF